MGITILGGYGFVGSWYTKLHYDAAVGNITSVNDREDYQVHSKDVLYFISTVDNHNVYSDPYLDINTNLITLVKVLENWRAREDAADGVFNFISSWFVESDVKGFYTSTKRCAEELLESYCKAFGLSYRIIRLANVVGPGDKKVSNKKNTLQYVIDQMKEDKDVYLHAGGEFHRDFIHAQDCVEAIELVLFKGKQNTAYNIGNGPTWSFREIVHYLHDFMNSKSKVTELDGQVVSYSMDSSPLRDLGYAPRYVEHNLYESLCR